MKLISMKNKKKKTLGKVKSTMAAEPVPSPDYDEPQYPWGLELTLEDNTLKKLPIDISNLEAGDEVYFTAKAKVTRLSLNEHVDSMTGKTRDNSSLSLQITDIGWGKP